MVLCRTSCFEVSGDFSAKFLSRENVMLKVEELNIKNL